MDSRDWPPCTQLHENEQLVNLSYVLDYPHIEII